MFQSSQGKCSQKNLTTDLGIPRLTPAPPDSSTARLSLLSEQVSSVVNIIKSNHSQAGIKPLSARFKAHFLEKNDLLKITTP